MIASHSHTLCNSNILDNKTNKSKKWGREQKGPEKERERERKKEREREREDRIRTAILRCFQGEPK